MTDPSISPAAAVQCCVFVLSEDFFASCSYDQRSDTSFIKQRIEEDPEDWYIYSYDFECPPGCEVQFAKAKMFDREWCSESIEFLIQCKDGENWKYIYESL